MPTGIYQSPNRRGGVKGRSGVYPKSEEHKKKISETLKKNILNGFKPNITGIVDYWLVNKRPSPSKETIDKIHKASRGLKRSIETRLKMGKKRENHWHWKEDRTQLKTVIGSEEKRSSIYKNWRREVCNRDNWNCKINNSDCNGRLEVHHILGFTEHPELRYIINNGITLCHFHHPRKRVEEKRLIPFFQSMVEVIRT